MSFFRYPGGKSKIKTVILNKLKDLMLSDINTYREPFLGGGSIGLNFIPTLPPSKTAWLNEYDPALCCLWNVALDRTREFKSRILEVIPSVELFFSIKQQLLNLNTIPIDEETQLEVALNKLLIHQMSYSGLGTRAGGPIGGVSQSSAYAVDCRWSPRNIIKKVEKLAKSLEDRVFIISCKDFEHLILDTTQRSMLYLDPPYYVKGSALYQYSFSNEDHIRLAGLLKDTDHVWLLSYDDCPEIRELYSWAKIEEVPIKYTITSTVNKESGIRSSNHTKELLISRR